METIETSTVVGVALLAVGVFVALRVVRAAARLLVLLALVAVAAGAYLWFGI